MLLKKFLAPFLVLAGAQAIPQPRTGIAPSEPSILAAVGPAPQASLPNHVTKYLEIMDNIEIRMASLNGAVLAFSSQSALRAPFRMMRLIKQSRRLKKALKKSIKKIHKLPTLTEEESAIVAKQVVKFVPLTRSLLDNLLFQKPQFDTAILHKGSVSKQIAKVLKKQSLLATNLTDVLLAKMSPKYQRAGRLLVVDLKKRYAEVLAQFEKKDPNHPDMFTVSGTWHMFTFHVKKLAHGIRHMFKYIFSHKYREQHKHDKYIEALARQKEHEEQLKRFAHRVDVGNDMTAFNSATNGSATVKS